MQRSFVNQNQIFTVLEIGNSSKGMSLNPIAWPMFTQQYHPKDVFCWAYGPAQPQSSNQCTTILKEL